MNKMPHDVIAYNKTSNFQKSTVPKGLLKSHNTKAGVWGLLTVLKGVVKYIIEDSNEEYILNSELKGVIEPEIKHHIVPSEDALFFIEFYK